MVATATRIAREEAIRTYYRAWEAQNWEAIAAVLADGFTFTSPNGDDHIGKSAFQTKCWPQASYIAHFELQSVALEGAEAFVRYRCRTRNGHSFQNVEYFRFDGGQVAAIEVYFGGNLGFPSAASLGHR